MDDPAAWLMGKFCILLTWLFKHPKEVKGFLMGVLVSVLFFGILSCSGC